MTQSPPVLAPASGARQYQEGARQYTPEQMQKYIERLKADNKVLKDELQTLKANNRKRGGQPLPGQRHLYLLR